MGYSIRNTEELFSRVRYGIKTTEEIREAMLERMVEIKERLEDRHRRVDKLREDNGISYERLAQLVSLYERGQYDSFVDYNKQKQGEHDAVIPAGVIANVVREYTMIESEQGQLRRLDLVSRTICDEEPYYNPETGEHGIRKCIHKLSDEELEFLGF